MSSNENFPVVHVANNPFVYQKKFPSRASYIANALPGGGVLIQASLSLYHIPIPLTRRRIPIHRLYPYSGPFQTKYTAHRILPHSRFPWLRNFSGRYQNSTLRRKSIGRATSPLPGHSWQHHRRNTSLPFHPRPDIKVEGGLGRF